MKKIHISLYISILWSSEVFQIVFLCISGITLHSMSKIIVQLGILKSMLSPYSCIMDCDAIFITIFESPTCYSNSKIIHEIHMM
jgi:hypothetical protein